MTQQRAGRIACPRCGANNFDTVSACWKCGATLGAVGGAVVPSLSNSTQMDYGASVPASASYSNAAPAFSNVAPTIERAPAAYASYPSQPAATGDPNVATRAAIALALTIPWIGLPVGWCFMMVEDARKQKVGRVCANWSIAGLILHCILMYFLTAGLMKSLVPMLLNASSAAARARSQVGGGDSMPDGMGQ